MERERQLNQLVELLAWIDKRTAGLSLPADERSLLASACFDVALEHQAAIAVLAQASLHGSAFALLRVLAEALVRGMWLLHCASETELAKFKTGKLEKSFGTLVKEVEEETQIPDSILSRFKASAWDAMNGFTHTGFHQVTRRHVPGRVEGNYSDEDVAKLLVAGALGLIAGGQIIGMANREDLVPEFYEQMALYAKGAP